MKTNRALLAVISSAAILLGFAPLASAQAERPEKVSQAIRDRYGNEARTEMDGQPRDINGVPVYTFHAKNSQGDGIAYITEFGDCLSAGLPIDFSRLPDSARQVRELFRSEPQDVETVAVTSYLFDVKRGGENRLYRLRYDAVGRLREVINPDEVDRTETTHFEKASSDMSRKIEDLALKRVADNSRDKDMRLKLKDVYKDPRYAGFYVAKYVKGDGKEFLVTINDDGTIYSVRNEIDLNDVPPPVRDEFTKMFSPNSLKWVYRTQTNYSQFKQNSGKNDMIVFRVRPDGNISEVRSDQIDSSAATLARDRAPGDAADRNSNNRNSTDRNTSDRNANDRTSGSDRINTDRNPRTNSR